MNITRISQKNIVNKPVRIKLTFPLLLILVLVVTVAGSSIEFMITDRVSISIELILVCSCWLVVVLKIFTRDKVILRRLHSNTNLIIALFLLFCATFPSLFMTSSVLSFLYLSQFCLLISVILLCILLFDSNKDRNIILLFMIISFSTVLLDALITGLSHKAQTSHIIRYGSVIVDRVGLADFNSNTFGIYVAINMFILFFAYNIYSNRITRIVILIIMSLTLWGLSLTFSRAAFLSLCAGLTYLFLASEVKMKYQILMLVSLMIIISFYFKPDLVTFYLRERIALTFFPQAVGFDVGIYNPRLLIWEYQLDLWKSGPIIELLFGRGFFFRPSDNTYLNLLISTGLIGLTAYMFFIRSLILAIVKKNQAKLLKHSVISVVLVFFVFSFFSDIFANRKLLITFCIFIGVFLGTSDEMATSEC